jgi:FMN-dependent NADH-azoreductase
LGFVGLKDVHFIYAEGLNMEHKELAFDEAKKAIEQEIAA